MDINDQVEFFDTPGKYPFTKKKGKKKKYKNGNGHAAPAPQPTLFNLEPIAAKTTNQELAFDLFNEGKHLVLHGTAGTGKTFLALYLALNEIINKRTFNKLYIVRSAVPTRNQGFIPGKLQQKAAVYEAPYQYICAQLFGRDDAYELLKQKGYIEFLTTSYIRGITLSDCIVLLEEFQNFSFGEFDSMMTRVGENCRLTIAGDYDQSDLGSKERYNVLKILNAMPSVGMVEFQIEDIQRSGLVKEYLIAKNEFLSQKA